MVPEHIVEAFLYITAEWSRVPFLPTDAHWKNAENNIRDRAAEKYGKEASDQAWERMAERWKR